MKSYNQKISFYIVIRKYTGMQDNKKIRRNSMIASEATDGLLTTYRYTYIFSEIHYSFLLWYNLNALRVFVFFFLTLTLIRMII